MQARWAGIIGVAIAATVTVAVAAPVGAGAAIIVRPGESIQAAVDAASPGSTIVVKAGTYAEHVTITTDGIRLLGQGATLVPPAEHPASACSFGAVSTDGICAIGELDFPDPNGPPVVIDPVSDVTISGFTVNGFEGTGVLFIGAENPIVSHNRAADNGGYGVARFLSTGGRIIGNQASGSAEAGIYVGDSPNADVKVVANESFDNGEFGFFLRDAANGRLAGNRSHGNCVGAIVLNTGGNVAGNWTLTGNAFTENNRFCPGSEEEGTPPLSGIGVAIVSAEGNTLEGNRVIDNVPSGDVPFAGGVVVIDIGTPGGNPPSDNLVQGNVIRGNQPDILWDGSGVGNVFRSNACESSVPDGLC